MTTCWRCAGPCATYKGSVHGWTCTQCLDAYLDESWARAVERDRRERMKQDQKRDRKLLAGTTSRGGGDDLRYVPVTAAPAPVTAAARTSDTTEGT